MPPSRFSAAIKPLEAKLGAYRLNTRCYLEYQHPWGLQVAEVLDANSPFQKGDRLIAIENQRLPNRFALRPFLMKSLFSSIK